jgi:5'-deoxynucleotidase YfbR-like HD superfamily hydrolase
MSEIDLDKISGFIRDYNSIYRFSRTHLVRPETVLQHIAVVSILSLYFADKINEKARDVLGQIVFDAKAKGELFDKIIVHDADEIVTGDVPRPTKYANLDMREKFKSVEISGMKKVIEDYDLPQPWYKNWKHAKDNITGELIRVTDLISVVFTCKSEISSYSNNDFKRISAEVYDYVQEASSEYSTLSRSAEKEKDRFVYNEFSHILEDCLDILHGLRYDT